MRHAGSEPTSDGASVSRHWKFEVSTRTLCVNLILSRDDVMGTGIGQTHDLRRCVKVGGFVVPDERHYAPPRVQWVFQSERSREILARWT